VIEDRLAELAFKKIKDELTPEEGGELAVMFEKTPSTKVLFEELIDPLNMAKTLRTIDELDVDATWLEYQRENGTNSGTEQQV
jgi:hypothetical protein